MQLGEINVLFGSKRVLGLDIGTNSIKIAELDVTRTGATLLSIGMIPTPIGALNGGDISNPAAVSQAIRSLANEIKVKRKNVATGLWGTAVIVKKITIPRVETKLLAQQIRWEAEQYIPFDVNEISLAFHVIPSRSAGDSMDILLVGAQNALVQQYQMAIAGAGFQMSVLDVSGFALANTFAMNYGRAAGQSIALINIGASVTNLIVVSDGDVVFSRDVPMGGLNYTNEVHKEMGISLTEAESLKLSACHKQEVPEQVQSVISTVNEAIAEEIRNSFDFYAASNSGSAITQCFFTGGASGTPHLAEKIGAAIAVPMNPMNPFARVKPSRGITPQYLVQAAPFAAVVVGLGLRQAGDS